MRAGVDHQVADPQGLAPLDLGGQRGDRLLPERVVGAAQVDQVGGVRHRLGPRRSRPGPSGRPRRGRRSAGAARHWLLLLVKTWTVENPTECAARTARSCPPAIDMCAPNFARIGLDPRSPEIAPADRVSCRSGSAWIYSEVGVKHGPPQGSPGERHGMDHLGHRPADLPGRRLADRPQATPTGRRGTGLRPGTPAVPPAARVARSPVPDRPGQSSTRSSGSDGRAPTGTTRSTGPATTRPVG